MQKKYLITGGAGMIGSNLGRELVDDGNTVLVVDNLWRGKLEYLTRENGEPLIDLRISLFGVAENKDGHSFI
jgi:GDP-D-mannose 3', 5'-epimerase